jgi:6-phosphogluconate dehydrogenase, C-terminal domain
MSRNVPTQTLLTPYVRLRTSRHFGNIKSLLTDICSEVGYRTARLPANLLQAQRDFFCAHTYERVDQPRGKFFHTDWTGKGGSVAASSYNA